MTCPPSRSLLDDSLDSTANNSELPAVSDDVTSVEWKKNNNHNMSNNHSNNSNNSNENNSQYISTTNFLIMSESGKPIFARHGTDEEASQICGLLQGVRASVLYDTTDVKAGDVQSIEMETMRIVFWNVKGLSLVAVAMRPILSGTQAYLRLVLETLYCQLTLALTEPVIESLQYAYYDLAAILGSTERQLHAICDNFEAQQQYHGPHSLHFCAIHPLYPMSSLLRETAAVALREIGNATPDTLFAFLFLPGEKQMGTTISAPSPTADASAATPGIATDSSTTKLVAFVQSSVRGLQMHPADLALLLHFCAQQPVRTSELWLPVCLPRFNASGYLYCYTCCLDPHDTGLTVAWMSHLGTTEQFGQFQQATGQLRERLSLVFAPKAMPLPVLELNNNDVDDGSDQDYVDASGDGDRMIPYVAARGFLEEVALAASLATKLHAEYLDVCQAVHFSFRFNVANIPQRRGATLTGRWSQCLTATREEHFATPERRQYLWSMYDKLMMRLRLGSSQSESIQDALQMTAMGHDESQKPAPLRPPLHVACPANALFESPPNLSGFASIRDKDNYLYFGINGEAFELYFTTSTNDVKHAAALGAALVRRILMDKAKLFVRFPVFWKN